MTDTLLVQLFQNINGLDGTPPIALFLIYRFVNDLKKGHKESALLGIKAVTAISIALIIARTLITIWG